MNEFSGENTAQALLSSMPVFRPFAYYDKHLDAIRVQIKDCSVWEERLDRFVTIYHDMYAQNPDRVNDVVGFVIKGIGHILDSLNIKPQKALNLANLLDEIVKKFPSETTQRVLEIYKGFGNDAPPDEIEYAQAA